MEENVSREKMIEIDETKDHEFCLRCGRRLKNPEARRLGYGAVCHRKIVTDFSTSGRRRLVGL